MSPSADQLRYARLVEAAMSRPYIKPEATATLNEVLVELRAIRAAVATLHDVVAEVRLLRDETALCGRDLLEEMRAIRAAVELLRASANKEPVGYPMGAVLGPLWRCGHRHATRGDAIRCECEQAAQSAAIE